MPRATYLQLANTRTASYTPVRTALTPDATTREGDFSARLGV